MTKNKKDRSTGDPFAAREAENYARPVASREYLLKLLEDAPGPLSHKKVCELLSLESEDDIEAVRRRLKAMVRDGQLVINRRGAFGRVDKMDLVKGRIIAHREGYGFVRPVEGGDDIYLTHRQMKKVFDGDEVLIRKGADNHRGQAEGNIVEVVQHNTKQLVGQFVNDRGHCYLRPDNPKIHHDIFIEPDTTLGAKSGQIVSVEITQQPGRNRYPKGVVSEILGDHLAPGMEIDVAIRSHGIPHQWPEAVQTAAAALRPEVEEKDKENRIDLRSLPFVTIDGEDARDFDDAVYCESKRSGGWRLYVAIADVSHYIAPGSALDEEAQNRGNSVYFPNHVVPMLPEVLSNGLCSLNPHVDRLTMVCEMTISAAGRISGYHFYEAVIHSHARLTYTEVGQLIAERSRKNSASRKQRAELLPHLDELHNLYQILRAARTERGAIDFETTETRIEFDEQRKIQQIVPVVRNDAHKLIEECMLAANVCAARFLEHHDLPALYRVHEPPKEEKLKLLHEFVTGMGLSMPSRDQVLPQDFQAILEQAIGRPDVNLVQTVLLRSMNQAVYQATNLGHFGLAHRCYAHFTSPIRRYPDLLVHRAIRSVIRSGKESSKVKRVEGMNQQSAQKLYPYSEAQVDALGEQCSHTERRADEATREVVSWLKCEYLRDRVGDVFDGVISAVTGFGLFVELKDIFIDGLVHITSLPQDYYHFSAANHALTGERSKKVFRLGDALTVQVVRVSLEDRKIDFELLEHKFRRKRSAAKNTPSSQAKNENPEQAQREAKVPKRAPRKRQARPDKNSEQANKSPEVNAESAKKNSKKKKAKSSDKPKKSKKAKAKTKSKKKKVTSS